MAVQVAAILKGVQIAGKVKDVAATVNMASGPLNINQNSIFAQNEKQGKGGALNSILQACDTTSGGMTGKMFQGADMLTGGTLSKTVQMTDKIATPLLEVADLAGGPDIEDATKIAKLGKKLPDLQA